MQINRVPRVALIDPVYYVAYSRPIRKGARYVEDAALQDIVLDKGVEAAREYALTAYQGVQVAVFVS